MQSALWTGKRRTGPVRMTFSASFEDERTATRGDYSVEVGLRPPAAAGFAFGPQIKEESLTIDSGLRPVDMMGRKGPVAFAREDSGRRVEHPVKLLDSDTALAILGSSGGYPEIGELRATVLGWRFYHGFRTDRDSPVRQPALAVTAPMLDEDGRNLAAVFATLVHIREDTVDLDRCIADALGGATLDVPIPGETATFGLRLPEFPQRLFRPEELSDGQVRFLALAGALLSYRLPQLIALNEPETSLHPSMLPALADMIARAAERTQVWIVTHSRALADEISARTGVHAMIVVRRDGATSIEGMGLDGRFGDE